MLMNIDVIPLRTNILCQATFCPSGLASISWSFDHINTNILLDQESNLGLLQL